jgi:hypothetical protein
MSKKSSTTLTMQAYQPFSSRHWYPAAVRDVRRPSKEAVGFDFDILNDPEQAGRTVRRELPAILTPNSLLCQFLNDGFGIQLKESESLDLATLVGRAVELRFTKAANGQEQSITAIRPGGEAAKLHKAETESVESEESDHGLG